MTTTTPVQTEAHSEPAPLIRSFSGAVSIDKGTRTIEFTFADRTPVERWSWQDLPKGASWRFDEILSMNPDHWDLSRVRSKSCPFLENHSPNARIGRVLKVTIDRGEETGKAKVKLRTTVEADELLKDLEDDTAPGISFGYLPRKYKVITPAVWEKDEVGYTRLVSKAVLEAQSIEVFEISTASIPAAPDVGFGRSLDLRAVEIEGDPRFEFESAETPKLREDKATMATIEELQGQLTQRDTELSTLRNQNQELQSALATAQREISGIVARQSVIIKLQSLRSEAEKLVDDTKLSAREFKNFFPDDFNPETEADKLIADNRADVRLEVLREYLDNATLRSPMLSTQVQVEQRLTPRPGGSEEETSDADDFLSSLQRPKRSY